MSIQSPSEVKARVDSLAKEAATARAAREREGAERDAKRLGPETTYVLAAIEHAVSTAERMPLDIDVTMLGAMPHPKAVEAGIQALKDAGWIDVEAREDGFGAWKRLLIRVDIRS
jgi:hypothetical protein